MTPVDQALLEEIEKRHGPQEPGHCAGGFPIVGHEICPTCGADDNDTCGRWVTYASEDIATLLRLLKEAMAQQRTPNTIEVCDHNIDIDELTIRCGMGPSVWSLCKIEDCPLRTGAPDPTLPRGDNA